MHRCLDVIELEKTLSSFSDHVTISGQFGLLHSHVRAWIRAGLTPMELHLVLYVVHHSYCHINLVKKTMYQWDIEKVGIYILYLPSDIHVQKYFEEPKKIFHLIFSFNSISKSRTTSNYIIRKLFSL